MQEQIESLEETREDFQNADTSTPLEPETEAAQPAGEDGGTPEGQTGIFGTPAEGEGSPLLGLGLTFDVFGIPQFNDVFTAAPLSVAPGATSPDLFHHASSLPDTSHATSLPFPALHDSDQLFDPQEPPAPVYPHGISDPLFPTQWAYENTLSPGNDINVIPVWDDFTGKGVIVSFIDDGVEFTHPDLAANYLPEYGYDGKFQTNDPSHQTPAERHGTSCAGITLAARNGIGIVGVAYDAQFSMGHVQFPIIDDITFHTEILRCLQHATYADVLNMSFRNGSFVDTTSYTDGLHALSENGRDGLGTVIVKSAGNERGTFESTSKDMVTGYHDVITVAATAEDGSFAYFSCPGSDLWVSAPGIDTASTDRTGSAGYNPDGDYCSFGGTSAAAPFVSGVVALMLEANPDLGYRDVQTILASTAKRTDQMTSEPSPYIHWDWQDNGASNLNGGGMHVSHDYGFGLVDALAAVRLSESWDHGVHTAANLQTLTQSATPNTPFAIGESTSSTISIGSHMSVEHVTIDITILGHDPAGLTLTLTSPDGTTSWIIDNSFITYHGSDFTHVFRESDSFLFGSSQHFGEDGFGDWTLTAANSALGDDRTFESWTMTLYGDTDDSNDLYVFTNEFSELSTVDTSRALLTDTAGIDTINASAVTTASTINLADGATSTIDGETLTIAAGSIIENVHTGDGDDLIFGNTADNNLCSWRGDDEISGFGGDDTLFGGTGKDQLTGGSGSDLFHYGDTDHGGDTVTDFSHADDTFGFDFEQFGQPGTGTLAADHFFTDAADVNVNDACFIFDDASLYYDADGTGSETAIHIADISGDAVQADDIGFV